MNFLRIATLIVSSCILFASCSSNENKKNISDSAVSPVSGLQKTNTDSGTLEVKSIPGLKESNATLTSAAGKITQKGKFYNNEKAGAWIKYDENGKAISALHFSKGKPIHELDPEDFNVRTINDKGFGATFQVPEKWIDGGSPDHSRLISFYKKLKDPAAELDPNFNFRHEKLQPGDSLKNIADTQMEILHENVGRVDMVEESYFVIDSSNAIRRYGMFSDESGSVGFLNAIIVSGNDVWVLSCEASNAKAGDFLSYQGVFQSILESFKRAKN
ncbi:hypothetical protein BH09BAC5_BH09BAC5_30020 [soil metagenome]